MAQIIRDTELDKALLNDGYVVIPFLEKQEVAELVNHFTEHHPFVIDAMYASAHSPDLDYRQAMNQKIIEVFRNKLDKYLDHITALGGSYIAKGSNKHGTLRPHQDWNIVDESQYRSFNLWVPLVDTSEENGGIMVLKGSHRYADIYRGPNINCAYSKLDDVLLANMETLNIPAGHALLYDHRLLHASGPNKTDKLRLTAVFGLITKDAPMRFYFRGETEVGEYASRPDFFMKNNPQEGPADLELLRNIPYNFPDFTVEELKKMAATTGREIIVPETSIAEPALEFSEIQPQSKPGLMKRLMSLFNS